MKIRKARQILKSLANDTRLRIMNLLKSEELTVSEICQLLQKEQSNISKHLTRLRLTGLVVDRRSGNKVYYFLNNSKDKEHMALLGAIIKGLSDVEVFNKDEKALSELQKQKRSA